MSSSGKHVTVLGGGSFGTAIANILADNGNQVSLWMRSEESVKDILSKNENVRYLPGVALNPQILPTTDILSSVENADIIFIAIPSSSFPNVVNTIKPSLNNNQVLVSTTKGIQAEGFRLMSQILKEETRCEHIGVLSGPNLAKEVTANSDMYGVELGGALKNIYAITAGMASAMGMGDNTKSMLITRSLAEMSRFAEKMGANPLTFLGLAGVGDLYVTCTSPLSRNFQVGQALAQGHSLEETLQNLGGTAEGVNTTRLVKEKADGMNVYMPLVNGLYEILFKNGQVKEVIKRLMLGEQNTDVEFVLPLNSEIKYYSGLSRHKKIFLTIFLNFLDLLLPRISFISSDTVTKNSLGSATQSKRSLMNPMFVCPKLGHRGLSSISFIYENPKSIIIG